MFVVVEIGLMLIGDGDLISIRAGFWVLCGGMLFSGFWYFRLMMKVLMISFFSENDFWVGV